MTIQIPTPPTYRDVPLPDAPTVNIPTLSVDDITEPVFTDPTNSLRNFAYERYASSINSLVDGEIEDALSWSGDDELFDAMANKSQDKIMGDLLGVHNKLLSDAGSRGFSIACGSLNKSIMSTGLDAEKELQASAVSIQGGLSDVAMKFIKWAESSGISGVKLGVDENKNIVYANIDAVGSIAKSLLDLQKNQMATFDDKVRLYTSAIGAVDTDLLSKSAAVMVYESGVDKAVAELDKIDVIVDEEHANNLATAIVNSEQLLLADECLQNAEKEKQLVLQTHATLNGYLASIKEIHSGLVGNRADASIILADVDLFKKQKQLAKQDSRLAIANINGASDTLNAYYKQSMAQVQKAKADIRAAESASDGTMYSAKMSSENYRASVKMALANYDVSDVTNIRLNELSIGDWQSHSVKYDKEVALSATNRAANEEALRAAYEAGKFIVKGCADRDRAEAMAESDTVLDLTHRIN